MASPSKSFWCHVIRRTTNGICLAQNNLSKTHISNKRIPIRADQNIFHFQISVNNFLRVEVFEAQCSGSNKKERIFCFARPIFVVLVQIENFPTECRLQQEINKLIIFVS